MGCYLLKAYAIIFRESILFVLYCHFTLKKFILNYYFRDSESNSGKESIIGGRTPNSLKADITFSKFVLKADSCLKLEGAFKL